jgi:hypothetical protein
MSEVRILNLKQTAEISREISPQNGEDISKRLQKLMLQIKGQFMCDEGKAVDYGAIRTSQVFSQYIEQCSRLADVDLRTLTDQEKMAFFISILCSKL